MVYCKRCGCPLNDHVTKCVVCGCEVTEQPAVLQAVSRSLADVPGVYENRKVPDIPIAVPETKGAVSVLVTAAVLAAGSLFYILSSLH